MGKNQKNDKGKTSVLHKTIVDWGWVPLIVAIIGVFSTSYLNKKDAREARLRLYTELIGRREQAESDLRKDMFTTVIKDFLGEQSSVKAQVLHLELLAYNFHESLDLKPLFVHLENRIENIEKEPESEISGTEKRYYLGRLTSIAREISRKQVAILETAGESFETEIVFDNPNDDKENHEALLASNEELGLNGITRNFKVTPLKVDPNTGEAIIRLEITLPIDPNDPNDPNRTSQDVRRKFPLGPFDFPMIENTRLPHDQRCAVVLNDLVDFRANITVICFPGSHASLREKAYYSEILQKLDIDNKKKSENGLLNSLFHKL